MAVAIAAVFQTIDPRALSAARRREVSGILAGAAGGAGAGAGAGGLFLGRAGGDGMLLDRAGSGTDALLLLHEEDGGLGGVDGGDGGGWGGWGGVDLFDSDLQL